MSSGCSSLCSLKLLLTAQIILHSCGGQQQLRVAYITTDTGQYVSNGSIPAVTLALDAVNNVFSDHFDLQMTTFSISVRANSCYKTRVTAVLK